MEISASGLPRIGEKEARVAVEPSHDAEIDDRDRAVRLDEHVAGVQVRMKKPVAKHLIEESLGRLALVRSAQDT